MAVTRWEMLTWSVTDDELEFFFDGVTFLFETTSPISEIHQRLPKS